MSFAVPGKLVLALGVALLISAPAVAQFDDEDATAPTQPSDIVAEGRELFDQGDYPGALAAAERAIVAANRTYAPAHVLQGDALKQLENYVDAAQAYKYATDLDATLAEAYVGRGESLLETDNQADLEYARDAFRQALNLDRDNPSTLSSLGHIEVMYGYATEAIRLLSQAVELEPSNSRSWRDLALAHAQLREFDDAISNLEKAIEVDGEDYKNYEVMASIKRIEEDYAGEVEAVTRAIETYKPEKRIDPDVFINGYIRRADARIRLGNETADAAQREADYRKVIDDANAVLAVAENEYPNNGVAYYWRGRAYRLLEDYSAAINSFTRAIQTAPIGDSQNWLSLAYLYRGICWYYQDSLDLARLDFVEAKSIGSGFDDPRIYLWIGFTYHKEGKYRQAIDSYGESAAKNPAFTLAHVNQGLAYSMLEEYSKAIESFNKAIRAEPLEPEHFYKVGIAQMKLGEFQKAVYAFDNALHIAPDVAKYHRAMAAALRANDEESLAATYEARAVELEP